MSKTTPTDDTGHDAPTSNLDEAETAEDNNDVAEHYREMTELGAHVKGEGEIK